MNLKKNQTFFSLILTERFLTPNTVSYLQFPLKLKKISGTKIAVYSTGGERRKK